MFRPWITEPTSYPATISDICLDADGSENYILFVRRNHDSDEQLLVRHGIFLEQFVARYFGEELPADRIAYAYVQRLVGQPVRAYYSQDLDGELILTGIDNLLGKGNLS